MQRNPARLLWLHILLAASPAAAVTLEGRVLAVNDGQSVMALVHNRRTQIRIAGIDAPTGTQHHAIASRQSLIAVCGGETARIETRDERSDGAIVARVSCNGIDAAAEQVKRGMAKVGPYADAPLTALEHEARAARRGVWSVRQAPAQRAAP